MGGFKAAFLVAFLSASVGAQDGQFYPPSPGFYPGVIPPNATPVANPRVIPQAFPLDLQRFGIRIPNIADPELRDILIFNKDRRTIFYKFNKVYQFHNANQPFRLFPATFLRDQNANLDFPWETTFGLNRSEEKDHTFNFLYLPYGKPIVIINERPIKWIFPDGAMVGEILLQLTPSGERVIFEIRTRKKVVDDWVVAVYRPIATAEELQTIFPRIDIYNVRRPVRRYFKLENPEEDKVFVAEGPLPVLPNLPETEVEYILRNYPFNKVNDEQWDRGMPGVKKFVGVPTSQQRFNLVPRDYLLGLVVQDDVTCRNCHRQTLISTARLTPRAPVIRNNPDYLGRIRGYDGIFTWHPFDFGSVSTDGRARVIKFRQWDFDNRFVELYDKNRHQEYRLTQFVRDSLEGVELPMANPELMTYAGATPRQPSPPKPLPNPLPAEPPPSEPPPEPGPGGWVKPNPQDPPQTPPRQPGSAEELDREIGQKYFKHVGCLNCHGPDMPNNHRFESDGTPVHPESDATTVYMMLMEGVSKMESPSMKFPNGMFSSFTNAREALSDSTKRNLLRQWVTSRGGEGVLKDPNQELSLMKQAQQADDAAIVERSEPMQK